MPSNMLAKLMLSRVLGNSAVGRSMFFPLPKARRAPPHPPACCKGKPGLHMTQPCSSKTWELQALLLQAHLPCPVLASSSQRQLLLATHLFKSAAWTGKSGSQTCAWYFPAHSPHPQLCWTSSRGPSGHLCHCHNGARELLSSDLEWSATIQG